MKKILYSIPTVLALILLSLGIAVGGIKDIDASFWIATALLLVATLFLSFNKWYGGVFGIAVGIMVIHSGMHEHGQVINEIPIGIVLCGFYAICAFFAYRDTRKN